MVDEWKVESEKPVSASVKSLDSDWKVESETPSKKSSALGATTDVINRSLVAGSLGAPVDIATQLANLGIAGVGYAGSKSGLLKTPPSLIDPSTVPGSSEYIGGLMQKSGVVSPTRRPMAETLTGLAPLALGLGGVGAVKGAKYISDLAKTAYGGRGKSLSESLRTGITGRAEDVIKRAEQAQVIPGKQLEAVAKAQEQLGGRGKVAGARQTQREKDVQSSLDQISPKKNVLAEDVGSAIQPEGQKNLEALRGTRQEEAIGKIKEPAFEDARTREQSGDFISTNKNSSKEFNDVVAEIEKQINRTPEPYQSTLKSRFAAIKGKEVPLSEGEARVEQLRASIQGREPSTTKTEPLTLDQAEFMRRMLNSKDITSVEGFPALDAQRMSNLSGRLEKAMSAYEPRVGQYLSKYKELSEPIARASAGRGKALTDLEIKAEQDALFSADKKQTANYFLDGTQEKAERLLQLVGNRKDKVIDPIKGFFRTQLESMNSKQANDFISKQEGFLRVFPELRIPLNKVASSKSIAETSGVSAEKRAGEAATRLTGQATQAESNIKTAETLAEKYRISVNKLSTQPIKEVSKEATSIVNNLRKDKIIDDNTHRQILQQIEEIKKQFGNTSEARKKIGLLTAGVAIPAIGVSQFYKIKGVMGF
jgi:adenylate kinase family enzyme